MSVLVARRALVGGLASGYYHGPKLLIRYHRALFLFVDHGVTT